MWENLELYIRESARQKLLGYQRANGEPAPIEVIEVEEALLNYYPKTRDPMPVKDERESNRTVPPTFWFIAQTTSERTLKVVVIPHKKAGLLILKSAHEPDQAEKEYFYGDH